MLKLPWFFQVHRVYRHMPAPLVIQPASVIETLCCTKEVIPGPPEKLPEGFSLQTSDDLLLQANQPILPKNVTSPHHHTHYLYHQP